MRVFFIPLESSSMFHQNGPRDAWKRIVGSENYKDYSYILRLNVLKNPKDMNSNLLNHVTNFHPDIIYMQIQETDLIYSETLREIKQRLPNVFIINWCGDYRPYDLKNFLRIGKEIDLSLLSNKGQLQHYRDLGVGNVDYMQIGTCSTIYGPLPDIKKQKKIIFCGNRSKVFVDSKKRDILMMRLQGHFQDKFEIYGSQWSDFPQLTVKSPVYHEKFNKLLNSMQVTVGINAINDLDFYFSERQLTHMASGTLHICHYVPGLESYFENKKHCVWYNTVDECVELCIYYLEHPDECNEIGKQGAEIVLKEHTWDCRFKWLLERVEQIKGGH